MLTKLIIFLPLIGFLCAGFSSRIFANHNSNHHTKADKFAQYFTTFLMFASAICAGILFYEFHQNREISTELIFPFINSGSFVANWEVHIDALSVVMFVVVTFVSSLVHLYSIVYMHEDKSVA
ncbi:MAG: hypothetical protein ACKOXJ_00835 [Alphaproteobacteria bacterium]